jgi:predicted O-methyltransferase YrrM
MRPLIASPQKEYLDSVLKGLEPWESQARQAAEALKLEAISLDKSEASFLHWCVQTARAEKAVEIGTLTGLSGLYILQGLLPGGTLWTLEKNPLHAEPALKILKDFAAEHKKNVEVLAGDARQTLSSIEASGPFDFIFIDGNKAAYGDYLLWTEKNLKAGGYLVADNVFLSGAVAENSVTTSGQKFSAKQIEVMRKFNERLVHSDFWRACFVPTQEGLIVAQRN